ncbi:hypothetical protein TM49_07620 [Martelella endophytica]|uniref:Uncharacterized protein n=1 Tax=Martelella endophytica TaxID=1486262 RepID=A0A0D5LP88_MAREN|nr:hypothetical protein TM49_07620 [Martelella endophytica]
MLLALPEICDLFKLRQMAKLGAKSPPSKPFGGDLKAFHGEVDVTSRRRLSGRRCRAANQCASFIPRENRTSVSAGMHASGLPFGAQFVGPSRPEVLLLNLGQAMAMITGGLPGVARSNG